MRAITMATKTTKKTKRKATATRGKKTTRARKPKT
jgi:hypothetical protein